MIWLITTTATTTPTKKRFRTSSWSWSFKAKNTAVCYWNYVWQNYTAEGTYF